MYGIVLAAGRGKSDSDISNSLCFPPEMPFLKARMRRK